MELATWNMQGGNATTENKWSEGVRNLMNTNNLSLICLQECGGRPGSATPYIQCPKIGDVEIYRWYGDTLLYYDWNPGGNNRCNMAIVLKTMPENIDVKGVFILPGASWRPLLCYQGNQRAYVSMHATRYGGDVKDLLNEAQNQFGDEGWIVAGDFNCEPGAADSKSWNICPPNNLTHSTKEPNKRLDYAARGKYDNRVVGQVLGLIMSDHFPVLFTI